MLSQQLKDHYPMQSKQLFKQHPIIQRISENKRWTVSNDNKLPLNTHDLMSGFIRLANVYDEVNPLTTLNALDDNENLDAVNRTYHLNASQNRILMVDAEPDAPDDVLQRVLAFPAEYTEISRNGGVHLLIQVPEHLITEENRYLFDLTVIKDKDLNVEYLFNNHFCTFTKKITTDKPISDINDPSYQQAITKLLNGIVAIDAKTKALREALLAQREVLVNTDDINTKLVSRITTLDGVQSLKRRLAQKSLADYNNDNSRYESAIASSYAFKIIETMNNINKSKKLKPLFDGFDESHIIHTVYVLLKESIDYREKHSTTRQGLPWLLMVSRDSVAFARVSNENKKKEKKEKRLETKANA